MITEIGSRLRITNPSPDMVDWCKKHLEIPNPEYQKKARMNLWLGDTPRTLVMYEVDGDSVIIPFGCLRSILPLLEGDVKKLFAKQVKVDYKGAKVPLYDYQKEAVGAMIINHYGILQSPAGSGKTQIGIALACSMQLKTLWLTHTKDLLTQSKNRAAQYIDKSLLGTITEGKVNIGETMTFATIQTMCKVNLNQYRDTWDCIIIDECHRVAGTPTAVTQFSKVLNTLRARHKYGLSATVHGKVYEPKERDIVSTRIKDRVFQRSLCDNYFYDTMTKSFIYDNCACQDGRGTEFARKRLICHLQKYYRKHGTEGWVLKADLKNFFGSTSHELAYSAVTKRVNDEWVNGEIKRIIDSFNQGDDPEVGMGLGSETTQLIQLAVLDDFDHFVKEQLHIKHYVRYNDDFIIIHEDKVYLQECLMKIDTWMTTRGLRLSPKKTQLFKVTQGIKFLGFRFRLTKTGKVVMTLLPEKLSHERRKLRKLVERAKQGYMTKEEVDRCYESWKAHVGNESSKKKKSPGRRARRNCHNLIICMDQYYKNLWRESKCLDLSVQENSL